MKYVVSLFLFVLMFAGMFSITRAQVDDIAGVQLALEMAPEIPGPNQMVRIILNSYSFDINSSKITWKVNGKTEKTGIGEKVLDFKTGNIGSRTTVEINVQSKDGEVANKTLVIAPSSVDLIWQSESYVPPFYKGKAMFSHQNKITFIAIPHIPGSNGQEINPKNLVYTWTKNRSVIPEASGYGKNTYTLEGSIISRPLEIEVEVAGSNTDSTGFARIIVKPSDPQIVFYKKDPLYGIRFEKSINNGFELSDSFEVSTIGIPFFFGVDDTYSNAISYKWALNGIDIQNSNTNIQTFRQKEGTSGKTRISLSITSANKILQSAMAEFDLSFGQKTSQNPTF